MGDNFKYQIWPSIAGYANYLCYSDKQPCDISGPRWRAMVRQLLRMINDGSV